MNFYQSTTPSWVKIVSSFHRLQLFHLHVLLHEILWLHIPGHVFKNVKPAKWFIVSDVLPLKRQTWKKLFCYHHKKWRKYVSRYSQVPWSIFMFKLQKYFKEKKPSRPIYFIWEVWCHRVFFKMQPRFVLNLALRVSSSPLTFGSEMKESVTNKPFVCFLLILVPIHSAKKRET